MTNAFDTLEQKEAGWVKTNRRPLIIGAGAVLVLEAILLCLWHLL